MRKSRAVNNDAPQKRNNNAAAPARMIVVAVAAARWDSRPRSSRIRSSSARTLPSIARSRSITLLPRSVRTICNASLTLPARRSSTVWRSSALFSPAARSIASTWLRRAPSALVSCRSDASDWSRRAPVLQ